MLEFARKQERAKYDELKFSIDLNHREKKPELSEQVSDGPVQSVTPEKSLLVWREGQQVLRQYPEEVGYTDSVVDLQSRRVQSLLGHSLELSRAREPREEVCGTPSVPGGNQQ